MTQLTRRVTMAADRPWRALMRLSLARRFRLASFLILVLGLIGIGAWVQRQIEDGILHSTASTTALYVESFVAPELGELAEGKPVSAQHSETLARLLQDTPLGKQIISFKLWGRDGFVLYDSHQSSTGQSFPVEPRLAKAWQGETTSRISDLESEENVMERQISSQLLETYSPVRLGDSGQIIAVAEFYQQIDDLSHDISLAQRRTWLLVAAAMLLIYLVLSGFVQQASDTIEGQQMKLTAQVDRLQDLLTQNAELSERVRRSSAQAAMINERFLRRISAELHDGPAQEISLALLRIDPGAEDAGSGGDLVQENSGQSKPDTIRGALQHALQELRAISGGLSLPELEQVALPEVIQRAVRAHERRTGTRVAMQVGQMPEQAPLVVKITVYRLIQEALNNAYRHAAAAGQAVQVDSREGELLVNIIDQGPGLDAALTPDGAEHLGLLGMRERVQSLGGIFEIESVTGRGTRVAARLALDAQESVHDVG